MKNKQSQIMLFGFICLITISQMAVSKISDTATIAFLRGKVTATDATTNLPRTLKKGSSIEPGDTIETNKKSIAQIIFPDKSFLYVKGSSKIQIEAFHFNPKKPEDDALGINLLKGSMRALSGSVGKRNPDRVKYKTRVSTIGIRGTVVRIEFTSSGEIKIHFIVGSGTSTNDSGSQAMGTGDALQVGSNTNPGFTFNWPLAANDPALIAKALVGKSYNQISSDIANRGSSMSAEDVFLLIAMENQIPGIAGGTTGIVKGLTLSGNQHAKIIGDILNIATKLNPQNAAALLQSSVDGGLDKKTALKSVLSGIQKSNPAQITNVIEQALKLGLTKEQASEVLSEGGQGACQ